MADINNECFMTNKKKLNRRERLLNNKFILLSRLKSNLIFYPEPASLVKLSLMCSHVTIYSPECNYHEIARRMFFL